MTCRWCEFFEALASQTCCDLCAPFLADGVSDQGEEPSELIGIFVQEDTQGGIIDSHPNEVRTDQGV